MKIFSRSSKGNVVKRVLAIAATALLLILSAPATSAIAIGSDSCHFTSMSYYGWPGGGSIDSGISVGLTRQMKTFEPFKTDAACVNYENTMTGTAKESVSSKGEFTWMLYGYTIPTETECSVGVSVNGMPWFSADAQRDGTAWVVRKTFDASQPDSLKPLLQLGSNELSAKSDCGDFEDGTTYLTAKMNVLEDSFGDFGGVSINDSDDYTNTAEVKLNLSFDGIIAQVAVSNDGGFPRSQTKVFDYKENTVDWTLRASTSKLPRKVYVRYRLFAAENDGTFGQWEKFVYSDDIILDAEAPVITTMRVNSTTSRGTTVLDKVGIALTKVKNISISAKDNMSGVEALEFAIAPASGKSVRATYGKPINLALTKSRNVVYVRAVDAAGNSGAWKALSTK
jgi:hypothetical protein